MGKECTFESSCLLSPLTVDGVSTIPLLFLAHPPWPWSHGSCLFLGEPKLRWKGSVEGQRGYTHESEGQKTNSGLSVSVLACTVWSSIGEITAAITGAASDGEAGLRSALARQATDGDCFVTDSVGGMSHTLGGYSLCGRFLC